MLTWGPPEQADLKEKVVRWTIALVFALKAHLRRKRNMTPDLEVLSQRSITKLGLSGTRMPAGVNRIMFARGWKDMLSACRPFH